MVTFPELTDAWSCVQQSLPLMSSFQLVLLYSTDVICQSRDKVVIPEAPCSGSTSRCSESSLCLQDLVETSSYCHGLCYSDNISSQRVLMKLPVKAGEAERVTTPIDECERTSW